jgi:hypothetical protein
MTWKRALLAVAVLFVAFAAFAVWKIGGPSMVLGMLRYDQRQEGKLQVGDRAPDVVLARLNGGSVRLSEFVGKRPLVLVFGSYT